MHAPTKDELIYSLNVLKEKYDQLQHESQCYIAMQKYEEGVSSHLNRKKIRSVAAVLLNSISKNENDEYTTKFVALMKSFGIDYVDQKNALMAKLNNQKSQLNSLRAVFNFKLANKLHDDIRDTQQQINLIDNKLSNKIDKGPKHEL